MEPTWSCQGAATFGPRADQLRAWGEAAGWQVMRAGENENRMRRSARWLFSFNYRDGRGEQRVSFRYHLYRELMILRVGNAGFPFEARLFGPAYQKTLGEIDAALNISARAEPPLERVQRMERLTRALVLLARNQPARREAEQRIRQIMTDFGSETADHIACARRLTLLRNGPIIGVGLCNGPLLSDVVHAPESLPPPAGPAEEFPDLSREDWAAVLRFCTRVLSDRERDADLH